MNKTNELQIKIIALLLLSTPMLS